MAPKYEQLVMALRRTLPQWYADGQRKLPCETGTRCAQFSVGRQTLRQALAVLEQEGLIEKRRGSGSFLPGGSQSEPAHRRDCDLAQRLHFSVTAQGYSGMPFRTRLFPSSFTPRKTPSIVSARSRALLLDPPAGILVEGCKTALPNPNAETVSEALRQRGLPMTFLRKLPGTARRILRRRRQLRRRLSAGRTPHPERASNNRRDFQIRRCTGGRALSRRGLRDARRRTFSRSMKISSGFPAFSATSLSNCEDESMLQNFLRQQLGSCHCRRRYNDEIAFPLIRTLLRAGKRVPEDIAVVAFDNSYYSTFGPVNHHLGRT